MQLEAAGGMHNRLTAAEAGVGDWPPPREVADTARWSWRRLMVPPALCALLLASAAWVPVAEFQQAKRPIEQPLAWSQLDSWIQTLEQSKIVDQPALEKVQQQLDELREQPPESWYQQSSLEAGDTLRDRTEQALHSLLEQLKKADDTLAAAERGREKSSPAQLGGMNRSLQAAAEAMEMGSLPLNKELLESLKNFDATKAKQLSASQLSDLRSKLQEGARVAQQTVSPGANVKKALAESAFGSGDGDRDGAGAGEGRGGGPAPLALNQDATNLRTKETATLANEDASQPLPGDLVGVQQAGEHQVEKVDRLPNVPGGLVSSTGEGGDAVRRETFTPREREVLQRFFK